ncbi:hypothetical protein MAR_011992 [Mya arenaria]|uniref:Uncharacterized protein n=1 Tax=Mya arenaria TaxID=6604 RepID=A0ABY7FZF8_MYAAR|nr:hypothetical protein MAR_011992 [Mya arenaria]
MSNCKDEIDVKPVPEEDEDNQSDQGGYDTKTEKTVDNGGKTGKVSDNDPTGSAGKLASSFLLAIVSISFAILL